ncbi:MAG: hypothetical protein DYG92_13250 [Leptolyngbya sp. PLA1]|nr:hypothetical protein [Leptolyngbya sp. PLA1]
MHSTRPLLIATLFLVTSCATPPLRSADSGPVGASGLVLNERRLAPGAGGAPPSLAAPPIGAVRFESPRSVLAYVLAAAPPRAFVYPTERYYYYRFPLGPRVVSGNIRFADAEERRISVGYFDASNGADLRTAEFRHGVDGVQLSFEPSRGEVRLALDGVARTFILDTSAFSPPSFPMLPGEVHVSGIRDESGYFLHLIYWPPERSFYYVLNTDRPRPERWHRGESSSVELWWGEESRFCFLKDRATGRFVLVGVSQREIRENTWFDGPFDQVPPRLPIRAMLEEAYPYVIDAGGLDAHGNFLTQPGQRVAISPYQEYVSGAELESYVASAVRDDPTPRAWIGATYEYKRDWRAPAAYESGGHAVFRSSAWPANHWGAASAAWGEGHTKESSARWPANHDPATSRVTR